MRAAAARSILVALVVLLAGACQVKTDVGVDVKGDGSGTVTVSIGLDDDATKVLGDLGATLRTEDLTKAGWTVAPPAKETDGFTYVRLQKPFANTDQAATVLAEVSGKTGPFRDFHITRSRSFAHTETAFTGTVDFSAGLAAFTDSALAQQLGGKPLGQDAAAIQKRIGVPLDRAFTFRIAVRLPGDVTSNATAKADNGAVWEPKLSDTAPAHLEAKGRSWRVSTLVFTAIGVIGLIALAIVLVVQVRRRRHAA